MPEASTPSAPAPPALGKRATLKRQLSVSSNRSSGSKGKKEEKKALAESDVPTDQLTNPDHFDANANTYVGTNKFGIVTGFERVTQPTMIDMKSKHGGTERVAADSGVFRRYGCQDHLVTGADNINGPNPEHVRPMADYQDGTLGSLFDRAVLCWPNLKMYGCRQRDPKTRTMLAKTKWRTMSNMDGYAQNLAKALVGYGFISDRTFTDESYPRAKTLKPLALMFHNREEFHVIEQAANKAKATLVPAYPSLGFDGVKTIFAEVQAQTLITDYATLDALCSKGGTKSGAWGLDHLVLLDSFSKDPTKEDLSYYKESSPENDRLKEMMAILGVRKVIRFSNLIRLGENLTNATNYKAYQGPGSQRERPTNQDGKKLADYENPSFRVAVDGTRLYDESSFAKAYAKPLTQRIHFAEAVAEDVQTICYTSGTTGLPKGVLITHQNLSSAGVAGALGVFQSEGMRFGLTEMGPNVTESPDMTYSVLPLVHIFERLITGYNYILGIQLAMFSMDPSQLVEEMKINQPTLFIGVPRIFQKILSGVEEKAAEGGIIKKSLYDLGVNGKSYYSERDGATTHMFWDNLMFNKIKGQVTGGRLKLILTGAAPLAPSTQYKVESLFNCNMVEGYGLTESMGAVAVRMIGDAKGCVGTVMPSVEIKLKQVVEMDLVDVRDQLKGEVLVRGNSICAGYFRRKDLNKETWCEDGWFHTGDVGQIQGGLLSIRDRKKAIFKLAQGEYISPERLEGFLLSALPWLENVMVTGRSTSRFACALVMLSPTKITGWTQPVHEDSDPALKQQWEAFLEKETPAIKARFMEEQRASMKTFDIMGYERIENIHILPYNITDPDLVTPTMKIKRIAVNRHYSDVIDSLCPDA